MSQEYDVAIIGAGPAGCACAMALYKSGLRVVLIDKEVFPRDKICGDAIPINALKGIAQINPEWGKALYRLSSKSDITASKIYSSNGKAITIKWKLKTYNSKRLDFDNFLLNLVRRETDTTILEGKRVDRIYINPEGVSCFFQDQYCVKAGIIIGCDGANSIVKRLLRADHPVVKTSAAAVRAYYSGVRGVVRGVNEFHLFKDLPGYFWIFPLQNDWVNVGFGISQSDRKRSQNPVNLRKTLDTILASGPEIAPRFKDAKIMDETKGFGLPLWTKKSPVSGERFMLCGDAASLIDPLQGHGIDKSIWSGLLAAAHAVKCIQSNNFSADFMSKYDQNLYNKVGPELVRSSMILKLMVRFPGLINTLTWLGQNQKLTNFLARKIKI